MTTTVATAKPHGLMFHHFCSEKHIEGQGAISQEQFDAVIRHYGDRIVPAQQWLDKAISNSLDEFDVCITLDDALLCQYDVAFPVLERHNLTAFWFVYSSVIEGGIENLEIYRKFRTVYFSDADNFYETFFRATDKSGYAKLVKTSLAGYDHRDWQHFPFYTTNDTLFRYIRDTALGPRRYEEIMQQIMDDYRLDIHEFSADLWMQPHHIKDLHRNGQVIGLHSHSHPTEMAKLSAIQQQSEYQTNFNYLNELLGTPPTVVSHPCNSYNEETIELLQRLGIRLGFRANMADHHCSILEFPREDHANIIRELYS